MCPHPPPLPAWRPAVTPALPHYGGSRGSLTGPPGWLLAKPAGGGRDVSQAWFPRRGEQKVPAVTEVHASSLSFAGMPGPRLSPGPTGPRVHAIPARRLGQGEASEASASAHLRGPAGVSNQDKLSFGAIFQYIRDNAESTRTESQLYWIKGRVVGPVTSLHGPVRLWRCQLRGVPLRLRQRPHLPAGSPAAPSAQLCWGSCERGCGSSPAFCPDAEAGIALPSSRKPLPLSSPPTSQVQIQGLLLQEASRS